MRLVRKVPREAVFAFTTVGGAWGVYDGHVPLTAYGYVTVAALAVAVFLAGRSAPR